MAGSPNAPGFGLLPLWLFGLLAWRHHARDKDLAREAELARAYVRESPQVAAAAGGVVEASLSSTRTTDGVPATYNFFVTEPKKLFVAVRVARYAAGPAFSVDCIKELPAESRHAYVEACVP